MSNLARDRGRPVRGRGRGLVFCDEDGSQVVGVGRGSDVSDLSPQNSSHLSIYLSVLNLKLNHYVKYGKGSIAEIIMEFFARGENDDSFMNNLLEAVLKRSELIDDFTKTMKLMTMHKEHGVTLKTMMFVKLQSLFEEKSALMKASAKLNIQQICTLRNVCDLFSQLYHRFRINAENQQRYTIFEEPVLESMFYLLNGTDMRNAQMLFKIVSHNYQALWQNHSDKLKRFGVQLRTVVAVCGQRADYTFVAWMMCTLECTTYQGFTFPPDVQEFYVAICGRKLLELAPSNRLLADIPDCVKKEGMDKFECTVESYEKSVFLAEY